MQDLKNFSTPLTGNGFSIKSLVGRGNKKNLILNSQVKKIEGIEEMKKLSSTPSYNKNNNNNNNGGLGGNTLTKLVQKKKLDETLSLF